MRVRAQQAEQGRQQREAPVTLTVGSPQTHVLPRPCASAGGLRGCAGVCGGSNGLVARRAACAPALKKHHIISIATTFLSAAPPSPAAGDEEAQH